MQRLFLNVVLVFPLVGFAMPSILHAQDAAFYNNRGIDLGVKGQYDKAIADFDQALRLNPDYADAYYNRGLAWDKKGNYDKAIADFSQVLRLDPKNILAYNKRGGAWEDKGNYAKAVTDYEQAMRLDPKDAEAYNNLAWIEATCPEQRYRDGKKALANAKQADLLTQGKNWDYLDTLAAAYAENGDFQKAMEWQEKATDMCAKDKQATEKDKQECRSHMASYKQGKPYHEESKKL